jgi:hypothetical protein
MNDVLEKMRTRGYWQVIIRPSTFLPTRVPDIASLEPLLQKTFVQFRGWDFPHIDRQNQIHVDQDWIGQELDWDLTLEVWRFYQSGQFVHFSGMPIDWRDQSGLWPSSKDTKWKAGSLLDIVETIYRLTEIYEFAARLSFTGAGDEQMHVEVRTANLKGRRLWIDPHLGRTSFVNEYKAAIDNFTDPHELQRTNLSANPREYALKTSLELFKRFNWNPPLELLQDMQSKLRR